MRRAGAPAVRPTRPTIKGSARLVDWPRSLQPSIRDLGYFASLCTSAGRSRPRCRGGGDPDYTEKNESRLNTSSAHDRPHHLLPVIEYDQVRCRSGFEPASLSWESGSPRGIQSCRPQRLLKVESGELHDVAHGLVHGEHTSGNRST